MDNHWICKPWNTAQHTDYYITNSLDAVIRLSETAPKVSDTCATIKQHNCVVEHCYIAREFLMSTCDISMYQHYRPYKCLIRVIIKTNIISSELSTWCNWLQHWTTKLGLYV